jgi:hypothetical protein
MGIIPLLFSFCAILLFKVVALFYWFCTDEPQKAASGIPQIPQEDNLKHASPELSLGGMTESRLGRTVPFSLSSRGLTYGTEILLIFKVLQAF